MEKSDEKRRSGVIFTAIVCLAIVISVFAFPCDAYGATAKRTPKPRKAQSQIPTTQQLLDSSVDITFFDVPVSTLAIGLSEAFGLNLAMSPTELTKQVTVNLKNTKLRDILDHLSILAEISWKIEGDTLVIAPKGRWVDEPQNRYAVRTYTFKNRNVADVMDVLKAGVEKLGGEITIKEDKLANSVLITGPEYVHETVAKVISGIDRKIDQIFVDVVFLEARVENGEAGGMSWAWSEITATFPENPSGFFFGTLTRSAVDIKAQIAGATNKGKAKVLNSTRILVQSGTEATLSSGEETPIVTNDLENGPKTDYKQTGVQLKLKPIVRRDGGIYMSISPTFSEVTGTVKTQMTEAPIVSNRSVTTEATLASGEWFVVGGLMKDRVSSSGNGVPLLKDVPLVGGLFRSSSETKTRTQTVVLIRPLLRGENVPVEEAVRFSPDNAVNRHISDTVVTITSSDHENMLRNKGAGSTVNGRFNDIYWEYMKRDETSTHVVEGQSAQQNATTQGVVAPVSGQ